MSDVEDILGKYRSRLKKNISFDDSQEAIQGTAFSREYHIFRKESLPRKLSFYENLCNGTGKLFNITPKGKEKEELIKAIETTHLNITPSGAAGVSILVALLFLFLAFVIAAFFFIFNGEISLLGILIPLVVMIVGVVFIKPVAKIPVYIASRFRLKASNQMVLCILYIVMYMRHTSNLERAIKFAADHIGNPLALDLRKVFWNIETGKFSTMKESLDGYLEGWRETNLEFVEAFHLIEGSLLESSETRRMSLLEKALDVELNGTYEKMLHYTHELKNPITLLHMLGVILPILGLVILPLMGSLVGGSGTTKIILLFLFYTLLLPVGVYLYGNSILSKRPTGYGENDVLSTDPKFKKFSNILIPFGGKQVSVNPAWIAVVIIGVFSFLAFLPLMFHFAGVDFPFIGGTNFVDSKSENGLSCVSGESCYGPLGAGSVILSLFLPFGLALGLGTYFRIKSKKLIGIRERTKKLEDEFAGSLFQLGNRIGDNIPVEQAFGDVSKNMGGTPTGEFFRTVSANIQRMGVSVEEAIFNKDYGAYWKYPSRLIESSMKVLLESSKKGPKVVAKSLISISEYIHSIHQVNERLKDLLGEIISSMKSQINFLTPVIAGIVVGISAMIVTILGRLGGLLTESNSGDAGGFGGLGGLGDIFQIANIIPSYYLQILVGIYVIEIILLLTFLSNGIENGVDKLQERYQASKYLYTSGILYFGVALAVTLIFTLLATTIPLGN